MKKIFLALAAALSLIAVNAQDSTATKISVKGRVFNLNGSGSSGGGGSADGNDFLTTASLVGRMVNFTVPNQAVVNLDLSPFALESQLTGYLPLSGGELTGSLSIGTHFTVNDIGQSWRFEQGGFGLNVGYESGVGTGIWPTIAAFSPTGIPTQDFHVADKEYVDNAVSGASDASTLGGVGSGSYLRSDAEDTVNANLLMSGAYLRHTNVAVPDANNIITSIPSNTFTTFLHSNGSANYPTSFGQAFVMRGSDSDGNRDLVLWKENGDGGEVFLGRWSDALGSWQWEEILTDRTGVRTSSTFVSQQSTLSSSSGTVSPAGNDANVYNITLTEDTTINNPSSPQTGAIYQFIVQQDGTGLHTLSWGNLFAFPDGSAPSMTLDPGAVDVYTAYWNGSIYITTYVQNFLTP